MSNYTEIIFIASILLVVYIYAGYPLLLAILSYFRSRQINSDYYYPTVTVLISAYNEESSIKATVINKLEQNYPTDKLNVFVVSDGSTDNTDLILERLSNEYPERVKFIKQQPRNGKTSALNMAVPMLTSDIIVFSDANSIYKKNAVIELVKNFSDPEVGYVTGKMIYSKIDNDKAENECSTYMKYENHLRMLETRVGSIVGVDGGIDAIRRNLYKPMRDDQLPDFVLPLQVVKDGHRVIYESGAVVYENSLSDSTAEFRMRIRVTLRALWALYDMRSLFINKSNKLFSLQLLSHKLLRYFAYVPLILAFIFNMMLLHNIFYLSLFCLQIAVYVLAIAGHMLKQKSDMKIITIPYYFVLINAASLYASILFFLGKKIVIWKPRLG